MGDTQKPTGTLLDTLDTQPSSVPAPAAPAVATPAPTSAPAPAVPSSNQTTGTLLDSLTPTPEQGTTPSESTGGAPVGEIRARNLNPDWWNFRAPGAFEDTVERVKNMFREPARSHRGDAYFRDHPEKQYSGFIAPQEFMTETEQKNHPMATAFGEFAGDMTSPENLLMLVGSEGLGVIPEIAKAYKLTPAVSGAMKLIPRLVSGGFGAQMLYGAYQQYPQFKAAFDSGDESEAKRILTHIVLSGAMSALAVQHAVKGEPAVKSTPPPATEAMMDGSAVDTKLAPSHEPTGQGTQFGPRTTLRPTTVKTAGVEAPIAASQQPNPPTAARVATRFTSPGAAQEFQKTQTAPAAHDQLRSTLGQVMQDNIDTHTSIANGTPRPEPAAGTQVRSDFQTIDEAAQAGERAAKETWKKGDAVDARELDEWQKQVDDVKAQVEEHNKLVEEHNSNLAEGEEPMEPMDASTLLPPKPTTLADVRSEWARAKANSRSSDPAVRQDAFDNQIPAAEKAMDKWFKQHPDDISAQEYQSVKRLTYQHERMQELANKLRGPMDTGTLTGNRLRNIEAAFNNKGAKYGRPNAFREFLGDAGYENWRNIAKVLDPLKGPSSVERGVELFLTGFLGHLMPAGIAAKLGTEFILNRALFDPAWGKWFTKNYANFKLTGKPTPDAQTEFNSLMESAKPTEAEAKKLGWSQEQIDKGEHLPQETPKPGVTYTDEALQKMGADKSKLVRNEEGLYEVPKPGYGGANKGVSTEQYEKAVESLNKQLTGGMKTGVPFPLGDMMTIGQYHLEAGARAFGEWSGKMVGELGEKIRPYLQDIWSKISAPKKSQFDAHNENGGSTFSVDGEDLGNSDAYSVGAYPTRTKKYSDAEWNPSLLEDFKTENADLLGQKDHAVGTWKNPDTGMHTLDVTRLIPDKEQALAVGREANQESIYHLRRGELHDTGGTGVAGLQHIVEDYNRKLGRPAVRAANTPVNREFASQIADAYDELKHDPKNPKVKAAYNALIEETKAQWKALEAAGYKLEPSETDPYGLDSDKPAFDEMAEDVKNNKRIKVWTGGQPPADHPLSKVDPETGVTYNTLFRAVHDIMGHVAGENDFSQQGEENAYGRHAQSYSDKAIPALTTETRGQTSHYFNNKRVRGGGTPDFVDQRAGLLPDKFHAGNEPKLRVHHWSNREGLTTVDPEFMGTGVRGAERSRMGDPGFVKRSNFGTDNYKERAVQSAKNHYVSDIDAHRYYDAVEDPEGIWAEGWKNGGDGTGAERAVHDAGYDGFRVRDEIASFKPVDVRPFEADVNASGESAASKEAIGRVASEKAQGIKRVKILKNGQEVPLIGVDAVDARAGRGETIVKRFADGHEEIQDQGPGANYRGPKSKTDSLAKAAGAPDKATPHAKASKTESLAKAAAGATSSEVSLKDGRVVTVSLEPNLEVGPNGDVYTVKSTYDGEVVGESTIGRVNTGRNAGKWYAIGTEVNPEWRRQGVATAMYDAMEKAGRPMLPGAATTPEIKAFWENRQGNTDVDLDQKLKDAFAKRKVEGDNDFVQQARESMPNATDSELLMEAERLRRASTEGPAAPVDNPASELPTRYPKGKNFTTEVNPDQHVDMAAMDEAARLAPSRKSADGNPIMGYDEKMARAVANYPGMRVTATEMKSPRKVMSKFIDHVASNLEFLYDQMPPQMRELARTWYDSANKVLAKAATRYGVTHEQAAGVTAVLSPSNAWDNNINLTHRMLRVWADHQNTQFSPEMEKKAIDLGQLYPQFRSLLDQLRGKSLSEIKVDDPDAQAVLKGLWIRMFDEAFHDPTNDLYSPDGTIHSKGAGRVAWQGNNALAKAVRILENPSLENINSNLGNGHKVRNFYNNLINPGSTRGHVTIDTHAVAAALLTPMANDSLWASQNFGSSVKGVPRAPGSDPTGLKGTYPLYAEAYRRVAAKLGITPRELQSIVWEGAKSLFQDKKTPEMAEKIADIWNQVGKKRLTLEQAHGMIKDVTGGFDKPGWMPDEVWENMERPAEGGAGNGFEFGGE